MNTRCPLFSRSDLLAAIEKTRTVGAHRDWELAADWSAQTILRDGPSATRSSTVRASAAPDGDAPLPEEVRRWMEPRFGEDFSGVRVHTGPGAARLCEALGARAFAYGASIYYGEGLVPGIDALTAHELSHVVQQKGQAPVVAPQVQLWPWDVADRTPERNAVFARKNEFVDRLNKVTASALNFRWDTTGLVADKAWLRCDPIPPTTRFQKFLREFVERTDQVIPLRFVPGEDPDPANPTDHRHICEDAFFSAAVDLDDLKAADDYGFQAVVVHILAERYSRPDYVNKVLNVPMPPKPREDPTYRSAHFAARDKEGELYQYLFRDPDIDAPHNFSPPGNVPYVTIFTSSKNGYAVVERIERPWDGTAKLQTCVVVGSSRKAQIDEWVAERARVAAPIAP
jgi:hypothetical protein